MNKLQTKDISKKYKEKNIVSNVSIDLSPGEVVGLLGPNGAGKTTCFYMITGLINPDGGKVLLNDKDITSLSMDQRAQLGIGYLAQEPSIFRGLSVEDNILAILEHQNLKSKEIDTKKELLLNKFNITHIRNNIGISLSGGERRRVEIARALASFPKFILLDEPFAGIDPLSVVDIQKIIKQLKTDGIGILITDHNVRETLGVCDRSYILSNSKLIAKGTKSEILKNETVKKVYLGESFKL
ncbi:MAG: LPS export ABC transporter ATP-binding protein [Gammaproteobacteria bacterium]|nr:LPS export ABC transporter ATP-binding protein [Gammaproteobacteria bacterium]|tara:strand:- start:6972 stop:7694 length:723 start_codon:yes stop_codon:yes gene_type:complete